MSATYDTIGINYAELRKPDPRIGAAIHAALGDARKVLNVGAGAGSYEPLDRDVTAVEPSAEMISQRAADAAPAIQGTAEDLPFKDNAFDASMAVLTIHHWSDQAKGLREMRRVTRGPISILTYDPAFRDFWLLDYLPELAALDDAQMPKLPFYEEVLGTAEIATVPIPHDCTDGFLSAYWRRPRAYLDPRIRAAMSSFWKLGDISAPLARLEADLASGAWNERYGQLLTREARDCGYRLVTSREHNCSLFVLDLWMAPGVGFRPWILTSNDPLPVAAGLIPMPAGAMSVSPAWTWMTAGRTRIPSPKS